MLIIDDIWQLNALVQALWEAKFDRKPEDCVMVAGSQLVAEVFEKAYDALIAAYRAKYMEGPASR